MGKRTWLVSLRSVKISIFALAVLGVSLVSSLGYSRPTSAEGFLQKTVQCVLSILVPYECGPATSTPITTAPAPSLAPTAETPSNSTSTNSSSSGAPVSSSPAAAAPTTSNEGVEYATLPAFLETEELKDIERAPELPASVHHRSFSYEPMAYLAYVYGVKGASTTSAASGNEVIESTSNGWHILGVAWYWWLVGLVVMASVVIWLKKAKYKRDLSIVNRP